MPDFLDLGVSKELAKALHSNGIAVPTPIQEMSIPAALSGKDIIAQAQTGTGKTFAFILPILQKLDPETVSIQALIVTPTRELALQITAEVERLAASIEGVNVLAVYGGQDVEKQLKKLKSRVQIVVATPGRLLDHIRRETVGLGEVSFLVLDEADQMLHIGFLNEVEDIIRETPANRQTMLFSATMPAEVRNLAKKHMRGPEYIQVEKTQGPAETVSQIAFQTTDRGRQGSLMGLIETHRPFMAVIFCRTKRRVGRLTEVLRGNGFSCDELHGDLSQAKREQVMKRFRNAEFQLLVATDVAARGLDVEGVTHVFNYDMPEDAESYVHRIGRTGRAGTKGLAITLFTLADKEQLLAIERELNIRIKKENAVGTEERRKDNPTQSNDKRKPRERLGGSRGDKGNGKRNFPRVKGSNPGEKRKSGQDDGSARKPESKNKKRSSSAGGRNQVDDSRQKPTQKRTPASGRTKKKR